MFLVALALGAGAGRLIWRDPHPVRPVRWSNLVLLLPALLAGPAFLLLLRLYPAGITTDGPVWLMGLALFRFLLLLLFTAVHSLPLFNPQQQASRWYSRLPLFVLVAGLAGETAVLLANHGVWPVSQTLFPAPDASWTAAMSRPAYVFLQNRSSQQVLPWLGLIWPLPKALRPLSALPAISPAQVVTALGCFWAGLAHMQAKTSKNAPQASPNA